MQKTNKLKKYFYGSLAVICLLVFSFSKTVAQGVGINSTGSKPDTSAMLDVSSTTKGFLPPRMTLAQRALISLPATGIIIYQTDGVSGLYLNKGTAAGPDWQLVGPAAPARSCFFFNTDQSISTNSYIGLGSSSASFLRNTIVVPFSCELTSIVLSTRESAYGQTITATVFVQRQGPFSQPVQTVLSATINGGTSYTATGNSIVPLFAGDLISVQFSASAGSLANGVAVSVTYQ